MKTNRRKFSHTSKAGSLLAACVVGLASISRGAVLNGDFETGTLSSWTLVGAGAAQTLSLGVTPPQGIYQGYITSSGNFAVSAPTVAASLGLTAPTILALGAGTPVNGSSFKQSITVSAGDVLTFDWNFISDELNEAPTYNDFAFFNISGSAFLLASRNSSSFSLVSPPPGFDGQTGWATASYTFSAGGTYTLGYGVLNVGDSGHDSALLVDSVSILPVPEPSALATLSLSLALLLSVRKRRLGRLV